MSAPRWAAWLLQRLSSDAHADDIVGDLEEAHRRRVERLGRTLAVLLTSLESLDVARALFVTRLARRPGISLLDLKLGFRMLVRYPGLTVVGGVSMAFAIWASASVFEFFHQIVRPTLPFDEGHRLVTVRAWDPAVNRQEARLTVEFLAWQERVPSLEDLGAYRATPRSLVVDGAAYPLAVAEMSASGFVVARVAPLHGRVLVEADERVGSSPVVVLGFEVWTRYFGADPDVVGRAISIGREAMTVVGVMPEGFGFPIRHEAWTPLRLEAATGGPRRAPAINVFGRLAPGASLGQARVEIAAVAAAVSPPSETPSGALRTDVVRYGATAFGVDPNAAIAAGLAGLTLLPVLLLLLMAATVALLMFARAASREAELTVRAALGASRRRIVGQLLVEALVLGSIAAVAGLLATGIGLRWLIGMFEAEVLDGQPVPFWVTDRVSVVTILYAGGLTLLGALVSGAGPALKITDDLASRLKSATPGGGGVTLGGVWTGVIVLQIAFTVVFPSVAFAVFREGMALRDYEIAIPDQEFVAVQVQMDREPAPGEDTTAAAFATRYRGQLDELTDRMRADAAVLGVTYAARLPRTYHPWNQVEVDGGAAPIADPRGHRVGRADVAVDYFDVLGASLLAGRGFTLGDVESGARVVVVDQPFIDRVLGGANPIGRRIRYVAAEGRGELGDDSPWYDIVGVAPDLGVRCGYGYGGIYHPTTASASYPLRIFLHVAGDPLSVVPRVRAAAAAVDPRLRLYEPLTLDRSTTFSEDAFYDFWITLAIIVCGLALLISLAAIYSVTSFSVVRRTREIGVRTALGGEAPRVVLAILSRPLLQVGAGIVLGLALTMALRGLAFDDVWTTSAVVLAYGVLMTVVCAAACVVPARRALGVEPTEALRADG